MPVQICSGTRMVFDGPGVGALQGFNYWQCGLLGTRSYAATRILGNQDLETFLPTTVNVNTMKFKQARVNGRHKCDFLRPAKMFRYLISGVQEWISKILTASLLSSETTSKEVNLAETAGKGSPLLSLSPVRHLKRLGGVA